MSLERSGGLIPKHIVLFLSSAGWLAGLCAVVNSNVKLDIYGGSMTNLTIVRYVD